VNNVGLTTRKD